MQQRSGHRPPFKAAPLMALVDATSSDACMREVTTAPLNRRLGTISYDHDIISMISAHAHVAVRSGQHALDGRLEPTPTSYAPSTPLNYYTFNGAANSPRYCKLREPVDMGIHR
ncbi:hypothetical protein F4824DRAFT_498241 [Ustulina deusta]|nr:hypothetical protein F4824DRAFT_498241 [Ustulina deusta]